MPKKPDDKSAPSQMVRIETRLWARMNNEGERVGRTARQEIEHRLRQSLGQTEPIEALELGSTSAAAAVGTLAALLTDECLEFASSGSECLGMIQVAVASALDFWEPDSPTPAKKQLAETLARALVLKVLSVKTDDAGVRSSAQDLMEGSAARRQRAMLLMKIDSGLAALGKDKS